MIERLRKALGGPLLRPSDDGYENARKIWNGAIDKRPDLIAFCGDTRDVVTAMLWARENDVEIAVRGGGHGVAGNALTDGGIVIDCSRMRGIEVDPARQVARVGAGVLLGDMTQATQAYGLAVPAGIVSHTGVAGLTLGGGIGWLTRRFGLTCDNLLAADLVTAEGRVVRASAKENPDLLWGLRGGGGNFGVVTSFEFRCHPVGPIVLAGPLVWPAEDARELLAFYREFSAAAPNDLTTISLIRNAPPAPWVPAEHHWRPVVVIALCYAGSLEAGERAIEPLRNWGRPLVDAVAPRQLASYHYFFDASVPHGLGYYWKSVYLKGLTDEVIGAFVDRGWQMTSPRSYTITFHLGGAIRDIDADDTAFEDRGAEYSPNVNAVWEDLDAPQDIDWTRGLFDTLVPASTGRSYVNFMSRDEQDRVADAYGETKLAKLTALKDRFDPQNVFRLNQNIPPSAASPDAPSLGPASHPQTH